MALEDTCMLDASVCLNLHMVLDLHREDSPMLSIALGQACTSEPPLSGSRVDSIDVGSSKSTPIPPKDG